jgi:hypothetical protein
VAINERRVVCDIEELIIKLTLKSSSSSTGLNDIQIRLDVLCKPQPNAEIPIEDEPSYDLALSYGLFTYI